MTDSKLKQIRLELKITQEAMLRRTSVSMSTLKNAESGRRITLGNAQHILATINGFLAEAGRDAIALKDLELNLY